MGFHIGPDVRAGSKAGAALRCGLASAPDSGLLVAAAAGTAVVRTAKTVASGNRISRITKLGTSRGPPPDVLRTVPRAVITERHPDEDFRLAASRLCRCCRFSGSSGNAVAWLLQTWSEINSAVQAGTVLLTILR